jgi:hypothetical protein
LLLVLLLCQLSSSQWRLCVVARWTPTTAAPMKQGSRQMAAPSCHNQQQQQQPGTQQMNYQGFMTRKQQTQQQQQ